MKNNANSMRRREYDWNSFAFDKWIQSSNTKVHFPNPIHIYDLPSFTLKQYILFYGTMSTVFYS